MSADKNLHTTQAEIPALSPAAADPEVQAKRAAPPRRAGNPSIRNRDAGFEQKRRRLTKSHPSSQPRNGFSGTRRARKVLLKAG